MTNSLRSAFTAFAATLLFALPAAADRLEFVSGSPQTAAPNTLLEAFVVRAVTDAGAVISGATVTFGNGLSSCGTYAGGTASATATTGANGVATSPRMTTGTNAGDCFLSASLPSNGPQAPAPVSFKITITGTGGPPQGGAANRLDVVSGSNQTAGPGVALAPFIVRATTTAGAPLAGAQVRFTQGFGASCGSFQGGASTPTATTGADGNATSPAFVTGTTAGSCAVSAGFVTTDITQGASATFNFTITAGASTSTNYQDMWWAGPSENGWGMAILQHETRLFAVIYAYDAAGRATWYVMPGATFNTNQTAFTGSLYKPSGSPFHAYSASALVVGEPVGTVTLTFTSASTATMNYTVGGLSGIKSIMRQSFANGVATPQTTSSDMWWGGSAQNGWGISILQQGQTLFSAWFTYNDAGQATWFVMPGGNWTTQDTYEGRLYRTTGSAWAGAAYNPASLVVTDAGTYKLRFSGLTMFFDYNFDGRTGTMALSRQAF